MPPSYFPLRWESTGDQWWYASPIDWAAANGLYDVVSELLHLDTNLLIKLTSLRRIRRLETVWDDEAQFHDVAKCRAYIARKLLHDCETKRGYNSLIRAGYGGWLLYTAASAGDVEFVKELLERDPLLVFGEGEYGVTDIFYAAARSKNSEVFRLLLDFSILPSSTEEPEEKPSESDSVFKSELMNRAVHAAARGGNLEILKEILGDRSDLLVYRDMQGSTLLHTASGRGQVEVVKDLLASFDIITTTDNQGNTALHVAAYRGYLAVVEVLILSTSSMTSITNNDGDTFLHMAVAGFRTPGFRRLDQQIELVKQLVSGKIVNIQDVINIRNNNGRTALHMAVTENIQSNLVELLMTVPSIDLNVHDDDGMTPLDLLKKRPRSASSEILIKQMISAGGISNFQDDTARNAIVSHLKGQGISGSPGTSFRIPDAEIFLYTGIENASEASGDLASVDYSTCLSQFSDYSSTKLGNNQKANSMNYAASLKFLLRWPRRKERKSASRESVDNYPHESHRNWEDRRPIPLREMYSKSMSLPGNKRTFAIRSDLPSPSTRMRFTEGLMQGVIQATPNFAISVDSPSGPFSQSSISSPTSLEKHKDVYSPGTPSSHPLLNGKTPNLIQKQPSFNKKLMNRYFCFGAQGLAVEDSMSYTRLKQSFNGVTSLVA